MNQWAMKTTEKHWFMTQTEIFNVLFVFSMFFCCFWLEHCRSIVKHCKTIKKHCKTSKKHCKTLTGCVMEQCKTLTRQPSWKFRQCSLFYWSVSTAKVDKTLKIKLKINKTQFPQMFHGTISKTPPNYQ